MRRFEIFILGLMVILFVQPCFSNDTDELLQSVDSYDPSHELKPLQTALLASAIYGKTDTVKRLLDSGVVFEWKLKTFKKAWIDIVLNKRMAVIELLLKAGMDVNAIDLEDINGRSALMQSTFSDEATVDFFLQKGAQIDLEDKEGQTALFHAIWKKDNQGIVARLIKAGADVNHVSHIKETPLLMAIGRENKEAVALLIEAKADMEYHQRPRVTPLIMAAERGLEDIVSLLLDKGACINASSPLSRTTALMEAANQGRTGVVKLLLARGADPSIKLPNGEDALQMATSGGSGEVVKLLLERQKATRNASPSEEILSEMFKAISQGHTNVLDAFLSQGNDANTTDKNGETLLIAACKNGQLDIVSLLLQRGANLEAKNLQGEKAVDGAVWKSDAPILKLLIDHGAKKPVHDINGMPPFLHAVQIGSLDLVKVLFSLGVDINKMDSMGQSPLHIAVVSSNNNVELVQFLLDNKADIEALEGGDACKALPLSTAPSQIPAPKSRDSLDCNPAPTVRNSVDFRPACPSVPQCVTPLMKAVSADRLEMVKILLDHGAKVNAQSPRSGTTALIEGAFLGDPRMVQLLLDHGADTNSRNMEGNDAVTVARSRTNTKAAALLEKAKAQKNK